MADDQRQLDLEGCARAGVGRQVLEVLLRTIATLAFGYAGETGVLEARIGFIFGMGDWFCILKEICMCEAGGGGLDHHSPIAEDQRQLILKAA